jgi:hypothetical protein
VDIYASSKHSQVVSGAASRLGGVMEIVLLVMSLCFSFILGRLTSFKQDKKTKKLIHELHTMTESRDRWREKYLVRVMKDKLEELNCKDHESSKD